MLICKTVLYTSRVARWKQDYILSGFIDGEGSFIICILKNNNKVGRQVKLEFWLSLHEGDKVLLEQIKNYFGVGNITKHYSNKILNYRISSTKDLAKIIDHLDQYPLITQKLADYELFKEGYNLVINKQHLTLSGLHEIVALKASINRGLSDHLQTAFPDVIPKIRPLVVNKTIADPQWLAGFSSAEGCFFVGIHKSSTIKIKVNVQLEFNLTQHSFFPGSEASRKARRSFNKKFNGVFKLWKSL